MSGQAQRVIVVGAGVIGTAAAFRLAQAGARVTVLDRAQPGQGTSANSFAWVNANEKEPRAYFQLNADSVHAHRRLRDAVREVCGAATWLHESGGLEWVESDAERERLLAKAARLREWGYQIEVVDECVVRSLEPGLRTDGLAAATFCADEAWVDGPVFCREVARAASALDATVREGTEVAGFERRDGQVTGVRLASGEVLEADTVVLAVGRWSDRVAALAGARVPLAPTCGLLTVTAPFEGRVGRVVHVPGMNFRPDPSGGMVLQSSETDATISDWTPPDPALPGCTRLLERLRTYLPAAERANVAAARIGVRPMPADGLSIVGEVAERLGLYLVVTHSGVTLAPLFGEIVADEVVGGRRDARLSGFRPERCVTVAD
jgi:glycine/D-amino acid oxidase-like deaminating enzyme